MCNSLTNRTLVEGVSGMGDILGGRVELLGYTKADLCDTGDFDADLRTMGDFDTDLTRKGPLERDLVETKLIGGLGVRRRLSFEALYLESSFLLNVALTSSS